MPALNSRPTSSSAEPEVEQHVGLAPTCCVRARGSSGEVDRVGVAVEQREAVQEERRRERAEQEVLDRRFLREQPAAARQPGHQVQRQRQHLERDEHQQQVVRRPGRSACRRPRTAAAGRPRSAPARCAASRRSAGEPTTTAADATIGLPTSTLRSAIEQRRHARRAPGSCPAGTARRRRSRASRRTAGRCRPATASRAGAVQQRRPSTSAADQRRRGSRPTCAANRSRARHDRLDEHAEQRRAEHDEDRQQRAVARPTAW